MTRREHQKRAETNAALLYRATWLLDRARLHFTLLGDVTAAYRVTRIIHSTHTERQHWLNAVDSPLP